MVVALQLALLLATQTIDGVPNAVATCTLEEGIQRPECWVTSEPASWDQAFADMLASDSCAPTGANLDPYGWPQYPGNDWRKGCVIILRSREYLFNSVLELPRPVLMLGSGGMPVAYSNTRLSFPAGTLPAGVWIPGYTTTRAVQCVDNSGCPSDANPPQTCATGVNNCGTQGNPSCVCTPIRGEYNGNVGRDGQGVMRQLHFGAGAVLKGLQVEFRGTSTSTMAHGVLFGGYGALEYVRIVGASGHGIEISTGLGGGGGNPSLGRMMFVEVVNSGGHGLHIPSAGGSNSNQWNFDHLSVIGTGGGGIAIKDCSKLGNSYIAPHVNGGRYAFDCASSAHSFLWYPYEEITGSSELSQAPYATVIGGNMRTDSASGRHLSATGWRGEVPYRNLSLASRLILGELGTSWMEYIRSNNEVLRWHESGGQVWLSMGRSGQPAMRFDLSRSGGPAWIPAFELGTKSANKIRFGAGILAERPVLPHSDWPNGSIYYRTDAGAANDVASYIVVSDVWHALAVVGASG